MNKLRLHLFKDCPRNCEGCCNKQFDIDNLPIAGVQNFRQAEEVLLTGGEPMLYPGFTAAAAQRIRLYNRKAKIYMYTAMVENVDAMFFIRQFVDGITVTLHHHRDLLSFFHFAERLSELEMETVVPLSLCLNVFKGINLDEGFDWWGRDVKKGASKHRLEKWGWVVKEDIEWLNPCLLPEGEVLMRWEESGA